MVWVPSGASIFLPPFEINRTDPVVVSGKSFRCLREDVSRGSRHPRRLAAGNLVVDDDDYATINVPRTRIFASASRGREISLRFLASTSKKRTSLERTRAPRSDAYTKK